MSTLQSVLFVIFIAASTLIAVLALAAIALHVAVRRQVKKRGGM